MFLSFSDNNNMRHVVRVDNIQHVDQFKDEYVIEVFNKHDNQAKFYTVEKETFSRVIRDLENYRKENKDCDNLPPIPNDNVVYDCDPYIEADLNEVKKELSKIPDNQTTIERCELIKRIAQEPVSLGTTFSYYQATEFINKMAIIYDQKIGELAYTSNLTLCEIKDNLSGVLTTKHGIKKIRIYIPNENDMTSNFMARIKTEFDCEIENFPF